MKASDPPLNTEKESAPKSIDHSRGIEGRSRETIKDLNSSAKLLDLPHGTGVSAAQLRARSATITTSGTASTIYPAAPYED